MRTKLELIEPTSGFVFDLVTLEALKLELGTPDSEDDANAARITRESKLIAEQCDRIFGFCEAVETFEFDTCEITRPGQPLHLRLYPQTTIESIMAGDTELTEDDYVVDAEKGRIWMPGASWSGTVVVTYAGGYDLPDNAAGGLQAACIEAVRGRGLALSRDPSIQTTHHGDTSVGYFSEQVVAGGLSARVMEMIRPFNHITV
jgi:hypothetical protein